MAGPMAEESLDVGRGSPGGGGGRGGDPRGNPRLSTHNGKSCKGCLYYSSLLKHDGRNPVCFGIGRTLKQVPEYFVGETEMEAAKDGRNLSDFNYACFGYSVFLDNEDNSGEKQENRAELPFCAGLELLVDKTSTTDHVPTHAHYKEDGAVRTQPQPYKPGHSSREEFFSRFSRNAGLVASGVAKNLHRVAIYVKEYLDDISYPYRRRPK